MKDLDTPALLFEMLKSFASLARTLNLSETVRELGSTRQTIRRHIDLLEEYKGHELFTFENRRYRLTEAGNDSLTEANELLTRACAWLHNESRHVNALQSLAFQNGDIPYFSQQHPLTKLWDESSDLMRFGFHSWANAQGELEHTSLKQLRPYLVVYRRNDEVCDWICTEVGAKSSFATWFGWQKYRSAIGKSTLSLPSGGRYNALLQQSFLDVSASRNVRLDHILTKLPLGEGEKITPVSYHRLILPFRYADGELALATLIDRTRNIDIIDIPDDTRLSMPAVLETNFTAPF